MRATVVVIACVAGCSFGVDPVDVALDGMTPDDLPMFVDDLAVQPDLTGAQDLSQLPDLVSPEDLMVVPDLRCAPPLFTGFGSGGAVSPFDCRGCGCTVDDFTALSAARWTANLPSEWTSSMAAGVLTFNTPGSSNGARATLTSDGKFYLDGDFDLVVDYKMVTWADGGGANLAALGPASTLPTVRAHTYFLSGIRHLYLDVDGQILDVGGASAGTFEVSRTGSTICAAAVGQQMKCRAASETKRVAVTLQNTVDNGACSATCSGGACCAQQVQFRNLRLVSGTIVDSP